MTETYIRFSESSSSHGGSERGHSHNPRRRWMITAGIVLGVLLLVCIIVLVLALTVFNIKNPKLELVSASVKGVAPHFSLSDLQMQFNLSLALQIRVENPNSASFRHEWGRSLITYRGSRVGEMNISSGFIPSHGSETFPCNLGVTFDAISTNTPQLFLDVQSGRVVVQADTQIPGRVSFMGGLIKRDAVAMAECDLAIGVPDVNVVSQGCKSHSKI